MSKHSASARPRGRPPRPRRRAARGPGEHGQRRVAPGVGALASPPRTAITAGSGSPASPARSTEPAQVGAQQGERAASTSVVAARSNSRNVPTASWRARRARREALGERLAERLLVRRVAVGVQQADRDPPRARRRDGVDAARSASSSAVERPSGPSARARRRGARAARAAPGGARRGGRGRRAPGGRARRRPRSPRGDEHGARALALQQRVGGDGRAVRERRDSLGEAPARSSAAVTAASTPSDWSSGVVGAFAVTSRSPTATTASVKVPPTSTPAARGGRYRAERAPQRDLLGLGEVLDATGSSRCAAAARADKRPATRRWPALDPVAVQVVSRWPAARRAIRGRT
jgi:hypothetical protein